MQLQAERDAKRLAEKSGDEPTPPPYVPKDDKDPSAPESTPDADAKEKE